MSAILDGVLELGPLVTGLHVGIGDGCGTAELTLTKAWPKDIDVCFDGERVSGVRSVSLNGNTVGETGVLRVRRFSREWAASETPIELTIIVRDRVDGHDLARLPCGHVTLGEPVSVDAKHMDVPLFAVPS